MPSPSRRFAAALHSFGWLRDLVAHGEPGAWEALRLTLGWGRLFGPWNIFAWEPRLLERRVFNLACNLAALSAPASEAEAEQLAADLARQARFLLGVRGAPERAAERATAAAAAGAALGGAAGERLLSRALARLGRVLPATVVADGGHASRSPQAALELLFDLQHTRRRLGAAAGHQPGRADARRGSPGRRGAVLHPRRRAPCGVSVRLAALGALRRRGRRAG